MRLESKFSLPKPQLSLLTILILGYIGLYKLVWLVPFNLPPEVYGTPSMTLAAFLYSIPFAGLILAPFSILLAAHSVFGWESFKYGRELRILIMVIGFPLLWTHVAYDYNYFLNQPHHFDRILLLGLYVLIWRHPVFVYPFLMILMLIMGQFVHPFGGLSTTDRLLPINIVILFSAYLFLQLRFWTPLKQVLEWVGLSILSKPEALREKTFLWAAISVVGASYFVPAVNKLRIFWPFRERIYYYVPRKYVWGWLGDLDIQIILEIYSIVQLLNPIAVAGTIAFETGAVLIMYRRKASIAVIMGFVFLHSMIFVFSGIAFWKWVIVDLAILWFILKLDSAEDQTLYNRRTVAIVTALVLLSPIIFHITMAPLAWYSHNYDENYTIEVVSNSGNSYEVHWSEMKPYDYTFSSNRFNYINNGTVLTPSSTNYQQASALREANSKEDVDEIKQQYGANHYDQQRAEQFDCFLQNYFKNRISGQGETFMWGSIPWPPHFWITESTESIPSDENITKVRVRKTEYLYTKDDIKKLDEEIVRTISLKSSKEDHCLI